jgi:hypothetical protein
MADELAKRIRDASKLNQRQTGEISDCFVHARNLALEELDANGRIRPEPPAPEPWPQTIPKAAKPQPEPEPEPDFHVSLDPARWREIQRDPKD